MDDQSRETGTGGISSFVCLLLLLSCACGASKTSQAPNKPTAAVSGHAESTRPAQAHPSPDAGTHLDKGILRINSIPQSTVFLDGVALGATPHNSVSVSPGEHKILFVNKALGRSKTITVSVSPGETKLAVIKLE